MSTPLWMRVGVALKQRPPGRQGLSKYQSFPPPPEGLKPVVDTKRLLLESKARAQGWESAVIISAVELKLPKPSLAKR